MISNAELNRRWVAALVETREMNAAALLLFRELEQEKDAHIAEQAAEIERLSRELREAKASAVKIAKIAIDGIAENIKLNRQQENQLPQEFKDKFKDL